MSKVFLTRAFDQIDRLFDAAEFSNIIKKDDFVALKVHFGERGNTAYLKPERVKPIVKKVRDGGGRPFWTDCNTLYQGSRSDTLSHLQTAFDHGYTFGKTGAHVLIADGLAGLKQVTKIEALLVLSHFKGHEVTGFGGALKNIGMGLASRAEKLEQHSDCPNCPEVSTCRKKQSLFSCWFASPPVVQKKIVDYAAGIIKQYKDKIGFLSFITDVSPNCDCYPHNDPPIVPDIGLLASVDPVAIDQAAVDLVNQQAGRDIIKATWPAIDWPDQLKYAEEIGLGSRKYELIEL